VSCLCCLAASGDGIPKEPVDEGREDRASTWDVTELLGAKGQRERAFEVS
jgi:hypothetical protein